MPIIYSIQKRALIPMSLLALFVLVFLFAGCGAAGKGGSSVTGSSPTSTPTVAPKLVKGYGSVNGCPSDMVVGTVPTTANVMLQPSDVNTTITAHNGDVIEVRLPFGHKWTGPLTSQGIMQIQTPAGYASKANNVCVWRFTAHGTGSTQLIFAGRPLCKPAQMCPLFIMAVPFKITVK